MKTRFLFILLISFLVPLIVNADPLENDQLFVTKKLPGKRGAHSHRTWSNGFIGLSVGGGFPMSDYGKADTIVGAGYAKIGINFNITGGVKLMPYVGIIAMAGGTFNGINVKVLNDQSASDTTGKASGIKPPTYSAKAYLITKYMAGGFLYFTDGESYDISIRILAGVAMVKFPIVTATQSSPSWTQDKTVEIPTSTGLGYDVGAGLNYKLAGRLSLLFNIDYFGTNVKYGKKTESTQVKFTNSPIVANSTYIDTKTYTQSVSLITVSMGVAFNF